MLLLLQEGSCQWGSVSFGTQCCQYFGDKCSWQSGIHWPATGISYKGDTRKICAHFHYLLVFEGKSSVQFLYYGQVSWGNITTDDSDPSHEKERSTCKKESVLLVTNVISSKIQYLINVILHEKLTLAQATQLSLRIQQAIFPGMSSLQISICCGECTFCTFIILFSLSAKILW